MKSKLLLLALFCLGMLGCQENAQKEAESTPSTKELQTYSQTTEIPEFVLTPDEVETRIGTLKFFDGIPTKETADLLYDHLDFIRGVETFLNGMPATSLEALRRGQEKLGARNSNQVIILDQLMDSKPLFLTGNTSTVYALAFLDLKKDGPTVIEIPAGAGPGTTNDAFFRFVIDHGPPGPDRGEGGKYLILPPDYEGEVPEGYFTAKSTTWVNWVALRGFLDKVESKPDEATKMWKEGLKIYPLSSTDSPPEMEFLSGSNMAWNTIHANDYTFYEELHAVIDREPIEMLDPELRGLFSSIGIQKGKPFNPDSRMKKLLTEAVAVGNGTSRALLWYERDPSAFLYENSYWKEGFIGGSYEYLKDEGMGGRNLDARTHFYYFATVNTPAMAWKLIGKGSQYAWGYLDAQGNILDGGESYRMNLPKDAPANRFISICVYDPQTRSMLQTNQPFPSYNSVRDKDKVITNEDGSVDLYFGPTPPENKDANWIQTVPGKGWFCLLRLYDPTEPWFEKTWQPGEITLVD